MSLNTDLSQGRSCWVSFSSALCTGCREICRFGRLRRLCLASTLGINFPLLLCLLFVVEGRGAGEGLGRRWGGGGEGGERSGE